MSFDWKMILFIWLILGIASSMFVYWDMERRKKVQGIWALLCIPLSVIGILLYALVRGRIKETGRELPPKPDYGKPEYRFKDEPKPVVKEEPKIEAESVEPVPEAKEVVPEPPKAEETLPTPPSTRESSWKEDNPIKMEQIEGIPRCPKCRSAVSSFDEVCGECGAKLK